MFILLLKLVAVHFGKFRAKAPKRRQIFYPIRPISSTRLFKCSLAVDEYEWMDVCIMCHIGIVWSISSRFNTFGYGQSVKCGSVREIVTWSVYSFALPSLCCSSWILFKMHSHMRVSPLAYRHVYILYCHLTHSPHNQLWWILCTGRLLLTTMLRRLFTVRASILSIYSRIQVISIWPYHCLTTHSHNQLCRSLSVFVSAAQWK